MLRERWLFISFKYSAIIYCWKNFQAIRKSILDTNHVALTIERDLKPAQIPPIPEDVRRILAKNRGFIKRQHRLPPATQQGQCGEPTEETQMTGGTAVQQTSTNPGTDGQGTAGGATRQSQSERKRKSNLALSIKKQIAEIFWGTLRMQRVILFFTFRTDGDYCGATWATGSGKGRHRQATGANSGAGRIAPWRREPELMIGLWMTDGWFAWNGTEVMLIWYLDVN